MMFEELEVNDMGNTAGSIVIQETANRIHQIREEKGLKAEEVISKTGMHRSTYYRYEAGDLKNMKLVKLIKIAEALGVHPAELIVWEEEKPASDESGLDDELMRRLISLNDSEISMVDAFVQGILASRSNRVSLPESKPK
jgi:transcriptional regulator with XRE-family HTH domain